MKYPIKSKIYFHSSKEDMWYLGEGLGLSEQQLDNFRYTGYEISVDIEIDNRGSAKATHFNGTKLKEKISI